jgi:pyruvate dehydrogenase E2 component (dihydrolipoamide acetyltransferase)
VAKELGVDWTTLVGSGRTGRIVERDVRAAAQLGSARTRVTPLARRVAQQAGVDVEELAGQLPGKRITRADIEAATRVSAGPSPVPIRAIPPATAAGPGKPMSQVRRIIADRMAASAHTVAPVTLTTDADATELVALRGRIKQALAGSSRPIPSYTDLLARLVSLLLQEHPALNSSLAGETIIQHEAVHVGIAVDTEQGLLVPVVRDAHLKSIQRIAAESAELIARARAGKSRADDLGGSTFTITNLGMYDIDAFTPIINLPDCAILGLGRIIARQVVIDEDAEIVAIRKMLVLSLTFDHRVVDGGPAARFLQQVKRWIEQPYAWVTA